MKDEQINESMAKDPAAYLAMQAHEIDAVVKGVSEQDPTYVMAAGRMRYMMSYWIRTRNDAPKDAKIGMAFNHIQECLREIVRLRSVLERIGRDSMDSRTVQIADDAIAEPQSGKPDHVCRTEDVP